MKTWLKGGLYGGIIGLIYGFICFLALGIELISNSLLWLFFTWHFFAVYTLFYILAQFASKHKLPLSNFLRNIINPINIDSITHIRFGVIITSILLGIIIGAIIGLIIQKIKE